MFETEVNLLLSIVAGIIFSVTHAAAATTTTTTTTTNLSPQATARWLD